MNIIERVKNILVTPKTEWEVIDGESATPPSLLTSYVLPLTVISLAGALIQSLFAAGSFGSKYMIMGIVVAFVLEIVLFYLLTYIVDALSTSFASEKNLNKSAQLVAYSRTPGFIAGLLSFIPFVNFLLIIAAWVYGIYLMYLGLGPLKKTPEDKKVVYLVVIFLVTIVSYFILLTVLGLIMAAALGITAAGTGKFGF